MRGRRAAAITRAIAVAALSVAGLFLPLTAGAQHATADDSGLPVFGGASVLFTVQPRGAAPAQVPDWGLRGSGLGVAGVFGAGRRVQVEAEVARGPEQSGFESFHASGGTVTESVVFRETFVAALVRWRPTHPSRSRVEPLVGVTFAAGGGAQVQHFEPDAPAPVPQPDYVIPLRKTSFGFGGGLDVVRPIGSRLSAAASFRLYRLVWDDLHRFYAPEPGIGHWVVQLGGGLRVSWRDASRTVAAPPAPSAAGGTANAPAPRGYAGVLVCLVSQPTGYADGHYLSLGLGGTGVGVVGFVGGFFHPHLSVETEVTVGPTLEADQWFVRTLRYATAYRDTLFSGFLRWHARPFRRNLVEPVFGFTLAAEHASRAAVYYDPLGRPEPPTDASVSRIRFGVGGGVDLVVPAGHRLAATASFRLHVIDRDDQWDGPPELGIGKWVYQAGAGLRWSF